MKYLLCVICCLFSVCGFSQLIGYSEKEIRDLNPNSQFEISYTDGIKTLSYYTNDGAFVYYLSPSNKCLIEKTFIYTSKVLKKVIENLNNSYVKIDDTNWKIYAKSGMVIDCSLVFDASSKFYYIRYMEAD